MAKTQTVAFQLKCTEKVEGEECGSLNYTTSKNATENKEKVELNKFCKMCRKTTPHKEVKIRKAIKK
jgi:large subunit ribosomal protein L33